MNIHFFCIFLDFFSKYFLLNLKLFRHNSYYTKNLIRNSPKSWQKSGYSRLQKYPFWNKFALTKKYLFFTGGLFDLAESKQEVAFRYAVERVNANRKILSQSLLSAIIEKIPPQDSFHASKRGKMTLIFFLLKGKQ